MQSGLNVLDIVVSKDALYHDFDVTGFGYKATEIPQMEVSCTERRRTPVRIRAQICPVNSDDGCRYRTTPASST